MFQLSNTGVIHWHNLSVKYTVISMFQGAKKSMWRQKIKIGAAIVSKT